MRPYIKLAHQTQPTPYACVHTCIAMLAGVPVAQVMERFPGDGMDMRETYAALEAMKLNWNALVFGRLVVDAVYLASVPSLNFEGGSHAVILDSRSGEIEVLDPNKGREGKRYYVGWENDPDDVKAIADGKAVRIRNWSETIIVNLPT